MNQQHLAIATMAWARDEVEEKLLREALPELSGLGIPVYLTDGGSGEAFLNFLKSLPNFILPDTSIKGLWPQVQHSLNNAYDSGAPFILYTEPDKRDFFKKGLPEMLASISLNERTGTILAARSAAGFASYPAFQQMTETTINNCCSEATGNDTDYTYGPFIMNSLLVPYLHGLKNEIGWGWRPFTFVISERLDLKTETLRGEYFCPPEQQVDSPSERVYRMRQLSENIEAIVLAKTATL